MPKFIVIVPVYGVELYIESCLRSIAAQTFSDFELILVDDGSQDRSIGLAEAYLRSTALTWRIIRQENAGQGIARDHGVREARRIMRMWPSVCSRWCRKRVASNSPSRKACTRAFPGRKCCAVFSAGL